MKVPFVLPALTVISDENGQNWCSFRQIRLGAKLLLCERFYMQLQLKAHHIIWLGGAKLQGVEHTGYLKPYCFSARFSWKALIY